MTSWERTEHGGEWHRLILTGEVKLRLRAWEVLEPGLGAPWRWSINHDLSAEAESFEAATAAAEAAAVVRLEGLGREVAAALEALRPS